MDAFKKGIGVLIMDNRNVIDQYKGWMEDLIKDDLQRKALPYSVLMQHIQGDFNMGTVIRNANAFGARQVFYFGHRKWDKRSALGVWNYTNVIYLSSMEELLALKSEYVFVGLELSDRSVDIKEFLWPKNALLIIGEEGPGIQSEILELCEHVVKIKQMGSVRSLNAGTASGIAMVDYMYKFGEGNEQ